MLDVAPWSAGGSVPWVELPRSHNALAVVAKGRVHAGAETASTGELVLFAHDGERLELTAVEDSHVIILAGEPINEPVVQYGPFVMNSVDEIRQAITDVNEGRFGPVPEGGSFPLGPRAVITVWLHAASRARPAVAAGLR